MDDLTFILLVGIGATALMDLWHLVRKQLFNVPNANWALVGRWVAYMVHGKFRHDSITALPPIRCECLIGWATHYLIGITYSFALVEIFGETWVHNPSIGPALSIGFITVLAPFLIMQPAMGAGFAASLTPKPKSARLHSIAAHGIFGLGLYLTGWSVKLACTL